MIRSLLKFSFSTNPYKILGINMNANQTEIKMAYYKMAQQYHPDKNNAKDAAKIFNEINSAYEILSDENKKRMYDQCGIKEENDDFDFDKEFSENIKGNTKKSKSKRQKKQYYSKNYGYEYESIFNEFDQFFQQKHGKRKPYYAKKKGDDITLNLTLSFKDSIFGISKELNYQKLEICDECKGSRSSKKSEPQKCYSCGGSGWLSYVDAGSQMDVKCTNCDGWGKVIRDPCQKCHGEGVIEINEERVIDIPKGVQDGNVIRMSGVGHKSRYGGSSGDLLINVKVIGDQQLRRDGHNIISDMALSVSEMVLGCRKEIDTIWGKLQINIPGCQQPRTKLQIPKYGIQYGQSSWKKGDHIVILQLSIPREISDNMKDLYCELSKVE